MVERITISPPNDAGIVTGVRPVGRTAPATDTVIKPNVGAMLQPNDHAPAQHVLPPSKVGRPARTHIRAKDVAPSGEAVDEHGGAPYSDRHWNTLLDTQHHDDGAREELQRWATSRIRNSRSFNDAQGIVKQLQEKNTEFNAHLYSAWMSQADAAGKHHAVLDIFDGIGAGVQLNPVIVTTWVKALGRVGVLAKAEEIFKRMESSPNPPDAKAYGAMMSAHANRGDYDDVENLIDRVGLRGIPVDDNMLGTRVIAYAKASIRA